MKGGNPKNMRPPRTKEEAKKRGRNGGIASGVARRKKRDMKQAAKLILEMGITNPKIAAKMSDFGIDENDITVQVAGMVAMANKMLKGDVGAARFLMEVSGQSPSERMHKEDAKLRRDEFEYTKEKDAGVTAEIEDLDDLEEDIYGGDKESDDEES